ncbi:MAG TPA: hypothetical protein VGH99_21605 [Pseudonocardia sp.]|jgi:hypothetical protein
MRPTIPEQLDGAMRLLDLVEGDDGLSAGSAELLRNAGRLLKRVRASWEPMLPFLVEDNRAMDELLAGIAPLLPGLAADLDGSPPDPAPPDPLPPDPAAVSRRNVELRALLARAIRELPRTPAGLAARTRIGSYLLGRIEIDPT